MNGPPKPAPLATSDETGGRDPLDNRLVAGPPPVRPRALGLLLRTRAALGLEPLAAPALLFVPLGLLLGPAGLGLIPLRALGHFDPVITLALAALGIFIGLALELGDEGDARLLAAATLEAFVTFAAVLGATLVLMRSWGLTLDVTSVLVASMLGVAASVSAAGGSGASADPVRRAATRVADLDDAITVIAGTVVVASVHEEGALGVAAIVGLTSLVGLLGGTIGWLLFERAHTAAERGVFVLGVLALVGGAAQYVRGSPLLAGAIAGVVWRRLPGSADRIIRADVGRFQHPLVVLLLVLAGAFVQFTPVALWLLAPFVVFRLTGKVIGAWAGTRLVRSISSAEMAAYLLPPGLLGIALALNFVQVSASPTTTAIASAVALGTLASEVLAVLAMSGEARE